jgi:RNA polymerase sigma-70 factor (ECF subfamily)
MNEYGDRIKRLCFVYLKDYALAEDAAQDTLVKAYKTFGSFASKTIINEQAWITRVAINTCRDYRRTSWFRLVDRRRPFEEAVGDWMAPQTDLAIRQEIDALPTKYKEVILLRYVEGMKADEISAVLRISRASVYARLKEACARLSISLEGEEQNECAE